MKISILFFFLSFPSCLTPDLYGVYERSAHQTICTPNDYSTIRDVPLLGYIRGAYERRLTSDGSKRASQSLSDMPVGVYTRITPKVQVVQGRSTHPTTALLYRRCLLSTLELHVRCDRLVRVPKHVAVFPIRHFVRSYIYNTCAYNFGLELHSR